MASVRDHIIVAGGVHYCGEDEFDDLLVITSCPTQLLSYRHVHLLLELQEANQARLMSCWMVRSLVIA